MKIVKYLAYIISFFALLCIYSWMIYHSSTGGTKLGLIKTPLLKFAGFPQQVQEVLTSSEVKDIPSTYILADPSFQPINKLNYDLYGVTTFWNKESSHWDMEVLNFKDDSVIHKWFFDKETYGDYHAPYKVSPPKNILLLPKKELIVSLTSTPTLCKLDSNSILIWRNIDFEYHHSINLDADSNIWVCASDKSEGNSRVYTGGLVKNLNGELISYWENYIVQIDINTGKTLFKKGVAKLLLENGYKSIVYGGNLKDPMHINDIQPALEDSEYWKKDDLFISVRHRSLIIQYRPSNNEVIKLIQGPFINQHDVDILSDHEISIFNNNYIVDFGFECNEAYTKVDSLNSSEVIIYNFETDTFNNYLQNVFLKEEIITEGQGLSEFLSNGDLFVEETDAGIYYVLNKDEIVLKKVFYTPNPDYIFMPLWVRTYEELPF